MRVKKYLFICKHNFTRSKYGAEFLRGYLKGKNLKGDVYSAGIGFSSNFVGKRINEKILKNSFRVFVMEKYMKKYLVEKFDFPKEKIVVLGIKDIYGFLHRKSIRDLDKKFERVNWKKYL